jgi:2-haloacid dehalogenase
MTPSAPSSRLRSPRAVLFDAYGTLFDVYSVAALAEQMFPAQGQALALAWRDKQIEYTRLVSMSAEPDLHYRPLWELTRAALRYTAQRLSLALDAAGEERLMNQYHHLSCFPEVKPLLQALKARGVPAALLSNGDPPMLEVALKSAGLDGLLDPVLSVHAVRRYKTDPAAYALGSSALQLAARDILFVSSNGWDAVGAAWFGYATLWINRAGAPAEQLDTPPTRTASNLRAVLDHFPNPARQTTP